MPTSPRGNVANSPEIIVKTVLFAGAMWVSTPTKRVENDTENLFAQQLDALLDSGEGLFLAEKRAQLGCAAGG